jgi:hypothetical protein
MRAPSRLAGRITGVCPWLLLVGAVLASLWYSRLGWELPLLDSWSFRQTQTAISTEYLLRDRFRFDYETPVLGAPWSVPYEFPTYQFCVALLVRITGLPLDQAGRLVSLLFAYGAFALLGLWVANATKSRTAGVYAAALALVSPVYLFGSRAFLIESTALCFTLGMLVALQWTLARPGSWAALGSLAAAATLAGLTKATTYAVGLVGVAATVGLHGSQLLTAWRAGGRDRRQMLALAAALTVPLLLTLWWTHHTDVVKMRNELAQFTTSAALHDWNYGTLSQRLTFATWEKFLYWVNHFVIGMPLGWVVVVLVIAASGRLPALWWVAWAMFFSGWLVFTNLYYVHEHYYYASGVYLLAAIAMALGTLADRGGLGHALAAAGAAAACGALMLAGYVKHTLPDQLRSDTGLLEVARAVDQLAPRDSVIVTYGYDWESALPYYAHRRALMVRNMDAGDDPAIVRARRRLDRPIGAIVFRRPGPADYPTFVVEQLAKYGLGRLRVHSSPHGEIYLAADPAAIAPEVWQRAGFAGKPALLEAPLPFCELLLDGRSVMLAHAPGLVGLAKEAGQRTLHLEFALTREAYTGNGATDGVTFVVEFENNVRQTTRLYERRLDPLRTPADRGLQTTTVALPADQVGLVRLRTLPGPSNAFDWSVWRNVRLE